MRTKMPRSKRAAQFAPFDALKGLSEALRFAEYESERISKGEISEEKADKISSALLNLEKNSTVKMIYFEDGHEKEYIGNIKVKLEEQVIEFGHKKIFLDSLMDLEIIV